MPTDARTSPRSRRSGLAMPLTASFEQAWLFTSSAQSVRITRALLQDGTCQLLIEGPDDAQEIRSFRDITTCIGDQAEIEQRLRASGFHLEGRAADRCAPGH